MNLGRRGGIILKSEGREQHPHGPNINYQKQGIPSHLDLCPLFLIRVLSIEALGLNIEKPGMVRSDPDMTTMQKDAYSFIHTWGTWVLVPTISTRKYFLALVE